MLIYPAIDLRAGECVRLLHGRFDAVTRYDADPFARLAAFAEAGAAWVHVVDLDGAEAGAPRQHALIGALARATGAKIQTGGGVREREDVERLLGAGAARVVVGSAAAKRPDEVRDWITEFGVEQVCAALDVTTDGPEPEVATHGWTQGSGLTLSTALAFYPEGALKHVLITDVGRDGALTGPNLALLAGVIAARPDLAVQASGGVATLADLPALSGIGAAGAIVGRALYEGRFTLEEALAA